MSAALAIPGVAASFPANADPATDPAEARFLYVDYEDSQKFDDRMRIQAPMWWVRSPLGTSTEIEGSFVLDSMSGASPYYLNTLTGASGLGVEDVRRSVDLKVSEYFENMTVGVSGIFSDEDDYTSVGGAVESRIWTPDKNTTFTVGVGGNTDKIESSIDQTLEEDRDVYNVLFGVTQVINPISIIQSNITFQTGDGYYTDPYKTFDNRPQSRDQFAWLTRYNVYVEQTDGSVHTDYRFYLDSWGISSHMVDLAWYQPITKEFMIRPHLRYYTQTDANFFSSDFPPETFGEQFLSYDQRLSQFGEVGGGIKLIYTLPCNFSLDARFEYFQQRRGLALGSGSDNVGTLYGRYFGFGLSKTF